MQIAFVSCTKKKKDYPCSAENMYSASTLFRKAFSCCVDRYDQLYILSAKYGLLKPDEEIEPVQKWKWSEQVYEQLRNEMSEHDWIWEEVEFVFHAGKEYRKFLIKLLPDTATVIRSVRRFGDWRTAWILHGGRLLKNAD